MQTLIKIFCFGIIILQLNCLLLKENEKHSGDLCLSPPTWGDDCALGATEVSESGEALAEKSAEAEASQETQVEGSEEKEGVDAVEVQPTVAVQPTEDAVVEPSEATDKDNNVTEAAPGAEGSEAKNVTETGAATGETNETTGNITLKQASPAVNTDCRAERRAARKAAREARRKKLSFGDFCQATAAAENKTILTVGKKKILRKAAKKLKKSGKKADYGCGGERVAEEEAENKTINLKAPRKLKQKGNEQCEPKPILRQAPPAEPEETCGCGSGPKKPVLTQSLAPQETNVTAGQAAAETKKGAELEQKLQELVGSIKATQDVTIKQLDELKNVELVVRPGAKAVEGKKEDAAAVTNETGTGTGVTETPETSEEPAAEVEGASNSTETTGAAETNATATNKTILTGGRERKGIWLKTEGAAQEPINPCKLKRRIARKLRKEARRNARCEQKDSANDQQQSCILLQKQWDLLANVKDTAPSIASAISEAVTIVKAKAAENSVAQGISETKSTEKAIAKGSENSISVANAVGKTASLTDANASKDSNAVGVTQSNTTGTADSNASKGSVSIANNQNTNLNTNELRAEDKSNTVGRTASTSVGAATSNASDKSLASSNSIDNSAAQSKLHADDNSITVGNSQVASNAKATSTSANQSKAQTVSESTGAGNTDLNAIKNSRALGNLELNSAADATADAVNGGNALGTANSKTIGANEGEACNNSTVIFNNKNENTATSNSKSNGIVQPVQPAEAPITPVSNVTEQPPAGVSLRAGGKSNETEAATEDSKEVAKESDVCGNRAIEDVKDIGSLGSLGFGDICSSDINAAKETEVDSDIEERNETKVQDTKEANGAETKLKSGVITADKEEETCGVKKAENTVLKSGVEKTDVSSCDDITLGKGIFRGNAHTKNICRNLCEKLNLPRVKRAEIKAGNDKLTIFRCLCGKQYTSWFKPNYGTTSIDTSTDDTAEDDVDTPKLTRSQNRRATRKASRRSLRSGRRDTTCGNTEETGIDRDNLTSGRKATTCGDTEETGIDRATLTSGRKASTCGGFLRSRSSSTAQVDLKPAVEEFIANNANSIKAQSADNLSKIQDLIASKTQSGDSTSPKLKSSNICSAW